jgi:hypothetical protein
MTKVVFMMEKRRTCSAGGSFRSMEADASGLTPGLPPAV